MTASNKTPSSHANNSYRALPSVSAILGQLQDVAMSHELLTQVVREELDGSSRTSSGGKPAIFGRHHRAMLGPYFASSNPAVSIRSSMERASCSTRISAERQ